MRSVSDTIARLAANRRSTAGSRPSEPAGRLVAFGPCEPNPGALVAKTYIPRDLADDAPLVVVLHGCTQTAAGYDAASGWSELADDLGFALLYPEQQRPNNPNLCFNWFNPTDTQRGAGEAQSIATMIEAMVATHRLDRRRVFITGLSAGGAMAAVLLATYPELFAGGGIVAGLPYGAANTIPEAFDRMRGHGGPSLIELAALLDGASKHDGPWPRLSLWHGGEDRTVSSSNTEDLIGQWHHVHDVGRLPTRTERIGHTTRRVWQGADGSDVMEAYVVPGMGHGTPLDATGDDALGAAAPFMLDVGICSTRRMAAFWGLFETRDGQAIVRKPRRSAAAHAHQETRPPSLTLASNGPAHRPSSRPASQGDRITNVIEDALRKAGLMR